MNKGALIIGAGDPTGGAIAQRFAREGYAACVTRRSLNCAILGAPRASSFLELFAKFTNY